MSCSNKTTQLQIRVTEAEKNAIQQAAQRQNLDMSRYVLEKILPSKAQEFQDFVTELAVSDEARFVLAEINKFLSRLNRAELKTVLLIVLPLGLTDYMSNYLAAMIETICNKHQTKIPGWVIKIKPLHKPVFATELHNLRLYLLTHSPAAFRSRNIFVDTTVGGQV
ncbi:MAG: DUF1778 domain-containing protein [Gammaproteobacteria bacterium]